MSKAQETYPVVNNHCFLLLFSPKNFGIYSHKINTLCLLFFPQKIQVIKENAQLKAQILSMRSDQTTSSSSYSGQPPMTTLRGPSMTGSKSTLAQTVPVGHHSDDTHSPPQLSSVDASLHKLKILKEEQLQKFKTSRRKIVSATSRLRNVPTADAQLVRSYAKHNDGVWDVAVPKSASCPYSIMGTVSADRTACIWNIKSGHCLMQYQGRLFRVVSSSKKMQILLTDLFIHVLIDRSIDWSIDGLIDRLFDRLIDWLIDWWIDRLMGWLIDWLIDWLNDWLIDWFFLLNMHSYLPLENLTALNFNGPSLFSRGYVIVKLCCWIWDALVVDINFNHDTSKKINSHVTLSWRAEWNIKRLFFSIAFSLLLVFVKKEEHWSIHFRLWICTKGSSKNDVNQGAEGGSGKKLRI